MWNPPPPDLQINIKRHLDVPNSTPLKSNSNDASPRVSQSNDQEGPLETSTTNNNNNNVNAINHVVNDRFGNTSHVLPYGSTFNRPTITSSLPHPRLEKVGPYLTIATLQAYTILTVVRCLADPIWIVRTNEKTGSAPTHVAEIGNLEKIFLACAIGFTMLSCVGVTLRILDKLPWFRKIPVITAYLEAAFCIAALASFLSTHTIPSGSQFSHGFLACVITVIFSSIVAIMLTVDWWRGFPSAGLSATLKALIISSFVMTIVIIIGAAIYYSLEDWTFDEAVNFCIVSFATIGYGNLSPKTKAGQVIFFFYGLLGISALGFFVVSLRNAVIEQFQWRLVDRFSKPAHLTRVQTRMSAKDISFPEARFEEEQRVHSLFVTLTTIGFGDYVPKEPGAVEFWNVYVFVGLSVFAYILSISSESMASQIHLVDDRDEDDDDMYGWERNEDPNAPLTTRSGILGLEGLKWLHHQQQLHPQGTNTDLRHDEDAKFTGNVGSINNTMQGLGRYCEDSTGRIFTISAKERRQMLQAEYYASHSLPAMIRLVDTKGIPHEKTIRRGSTHENISGLSDVANSDQPGNTYATVGYYGTNGKLDLERVNRASRLRNEPRIGGTRTADHGTNTTMARNQPQIRFGTPTSTVHGTGRRFNEVPDERRESEAGHIPSCMDLFSQPSQYNSGEGSSRQGDDFLGIQGDVVTRIRANSWDHSATQQRRGPSQNEIDRWLAEEAGMLEGPNFNYVTRRHLNPTTNDGLSRPSQSSDGTTRVPSSPGDNDRSPSSPEHDRQGLLQEHRIQNCEGASSLDEILIPLTTEPTIMNTNEETQFLAGQDVERIERGLEPNLRHPRQTLATSVHGSILPSNRSVNHTPETNDLYLRGGGSGPGHEPYAHGVPLSGSNSKENGEDTRTSAPRPLELFVDDDRPYTPQQSNHSQPLSIFSNHPRSEQGSTAHTPSGSIHHSRPPSVLMTIFDEPVRNLQGSRLVSRTNSLSTSRSHSRGTSTERLVSGASPAESQEPEGHNPPFPSSVISDVGVGPFDEIRNPETIPHFDQDIDLNHLEMTPQQIEEEKKRRAELRREREIEARLAILRERGRGDYA
ncbi:Potassium channel [Modicella reniformis]|uniref:Potassium channel n=1 Tax=Modicella reniformis TaxID=1440133 RepID=A0A9P6INX2_9FUNG|nr:Potassium channel [Modicella reniformis]